MLVAVLLHKHQVDTYRITCMRPQSIAALLPDSTQQVIMYKTYISRMSEPAECPSMQNAVRDAKMYCDESLRNGEAMPECRQLSGSSRRCLSR